MPNEEQAAKDAAKTLCDNFKEEKELREIIDAILGKLKRSNLSAEDGKKCAEKLKALYERLEKVE